jgi:hypothetical protein
MRLQVLSSVSPVPENTQTRHYDDDDFISQITITIEKIAPLFAPINR